MTPFEEKMIILEQRKLNELEKINEILHALNENLRDTLGSAETGDALVAITKIPEELNSLVDTLDNKEE